ncbi:MAG TPA: VOC family protein [Solirubrobacterales bacterium]|nr:VOC family protein [Solirubrobacterales bacterium]
MLAQSKATSGFAVKDLGAAREFYEGTLGLDVEVLSEEHGVTRLKLAGDYEVLMYLSPEMTPASYTMLNFEVDDIDAAVDELGERGVGFERYDGFPHDEKGIVRGPGPQIAWFEDPSGNVIAVMQQP